MNKKSLALKISEELLEEIEKLDDSIANILLKIKRMALLLGDADAQNWIDLELRGYPQKFYFESLGNCKKYAIQGGRINSETNKYYLQSLPEFEAQASLNNNILTNLKLPNSISPSVSSSNQYERPGDTISSTIKNTMKNYYQHLENTKTNTIFYIKIFNSIKGAIHNYVIDTYLALQFGDLNEKFFDENRTIVDTFIRTQCPKAVDQLLALNDAAQKNEVEYLSHAMTSIRRILLTIADYIFPPSNVDYLDKRGKKRKVGPEEYKNRLIAYFEINQSLASSPFYNTEIDLIASKIDFLYEKSCKGIHSDTSRSELNLIVIQTYLLIAEIALIEKDKTDKSKIAGIPDSDLT
ncbi:AbiTii domain-containing protein [Leptospira levettii]|uniref:AbiTii domain-containing protein n=1 Tax=Leptospira levettii TaxID=2023178 RepID=A0AAW5V7Y6_9LEPT|nr:hypothetical protein [Leptospira levettii]MCW7467813.1 hypothetical protein [Leptospira levettii]MCW7513445.1 hypothetical protein [Leptospira levettii]MCW7517207.1 hypothetical protein [Leptospira levettii]